MDSSTSSSTPLSYNRKICTTNPCTNKPSKDFPFLTRDEVTSMIAKGYEGFLKTKKTPLSERKAKLNKFADLFEANSDEIANTMASQMGKPVSQGVLQVKRCATDTRYYADNLQKLLSQHDVKTEATHSFYVAEPIGVIYIIVPFNWPAILSLRGIIPNIALGNSVFVRFADSTPQLGLLFQKIFRDAGFVDHQVQNAFSAPTDLDFILSQPQIKGVIFTGSTKVGSIIASTAGQNLQKAVVELGGSDPVLILEDVDINQAVDLTMVCRMRNAGQTCIAGKRFIIHQKHLEKYLQLVKSKLEAQVIGDPLLKETQMGPLARKDIVDSVHSQVEASIKEGSKLIYGGKKYEQFENEDFKNGNFYYPTLIHCSPDSILFREEVFGPVIAVTTFKTEEEAIQIANNSDFGLGSVIITNNQTHAEELALQIESGMVFINTFVRGDPRLPFGGMKQSGIGRAYHELGFMEFANVQTVYNS